MKIAAFIFTLLLASQIAVAAEFEPQAISAESAYKLTNVDKQRYNPATSSADAESAKYLDTIFNITDILVVERVSKQMQLQQTGNFVSLKNYEIAQKELDAITPPENLRQAHNLLKQAIEEQILYFRKLVSSKQQFNASDALVQSSNDKLVEIYNILLRNFPNENSENKKSFYSHLCGLDFI